MPYPNSIFTFAHLLDYGKIFQLVKLDQKKKLYSMFLEGHDSQSFQMHSNVAFLKTNGMKCQFGIVKELIKNWN
jgi:hypothetical protein